MKIEHIAIWTPRLDLMKAYYEKYFGGQAGPEYENPARQFRSYFLSFESGSRLELMSTPRIIEKSGRQDAPEQKGITHFAFQVKSVEEVDNKARELARNGYAILDGPRITGDGYYEFVTLDPDNNRVEVTARWTG